jgi:DNA processing protein
VVDSRLKARPEELQEVRALLLLKERFGLGDRGIRKVVDLHGSASRALEARRRQANLPERNEEAPLSSWIEEGYGILPMTSPRYPASLSELTDPPPVLFLKGRWKLLSGPSVAIVGSRRATEVGRRAAETMGRILAEAGITVVSGLALGIDGAAHRGALKGRGGTVAVLGSGFQVVYPGSHRSLFREIGERGLLVSEFLPGQPALPHHFPKRNRIIAALTRAVVVVEAGFRSGALITVDHALDLGREILVTPGSVENPQAVGSNALIREGARVVPDPAGILEELQGLGLDMGKEIERVSAPEIPGSHVPSELREIWAALSNEPACIDEVASRAALSVNQALAGLSALELGGWARRCPGMRFQRLGSEGMGTRGGQSDAGG